MFVIVIRKF